MRAGVFGGQDLALDAALPEPGADDDAGQSGQLLSRILAGDLLAVDEVRLHLVVVVGSRMGKALQNALVGILQVVFAYKTDIDDGLCLLAAVEKVKPRSEVGCLARIQSHLLETDGVEALAPHVDRHFVDAGQVLALDNRIHLHVAEVGNLPPKFIAQVVLGAQH